VEAAVSRQVRSTHARVREVPAERPEGRDAEELEGNEHRSVYHYTEPPDATPENTLVWILKLEPGATRALEYDFDADIKDVEGENRFEQGG